MLKQGAHLMPNHQGSQDPWQQLVDFNDQVAFTYRSQQGDSYNGTIAMIRPADILYFRKYGDKGSLIVTMDRNSGRPKGHHIKETPEQVLAQIGQGASDSYEQMKAAGTLPTHRLPETHFVRAHTSRHDNIRSGTPVFLRLDRVSELRTGRVSKGQAVAIFRYPRTDARVFSLQETPNQLLAMAGKAPALTYADRQKLAETSRPSTGPGR
ncbi:MAG: hypothetical protein Alpg2KO_09680 [Alphaproteobacteria bacterium]